MYVYVYVYVYVYIYVHSGLGFAAGGRGPAAVESIFSLSAL